MSDRSTDQSSLASSTEYPRGLSLHHDPHLNKGIAFTQAERDALGLRGLLPARVLSLDAQVMRVLNNLRRKPNDLEKYIFTMALLDRNETLFYRLVQDNLKELMPIIYTPTVGQACLEYGQIFQHSRGLYITANDRGKIAQILGNWPATDVRVIVVTDGERILGLGDLGAHGMGIPVGKLALYTACAGINPAFCLPVMLDLGTENPTLLDDPLYIGLPQRRVRGAAYDELFEEFIEAVQERYPQALVQLEDFGNANAFRLLKDYRDRLCLFDDDIQGTGAVALAGLYSALRITGKPLTEQTVVFLGAGEAALGIGELVVAAMMEAGLSLEAARQRCWFVDSKGLVVKDRTDLSDHKRTYAHDYPGLPDLLSTVEALHPTALIGAAGQAKMFTQPVLEAMARLNERPIVFAMSNPTSKQECSAVEAYAWTDGRVIFTSGSPSDPLLINGKPVIIGQGNNAYIFPGVGLGIVSCGITRVTNEMFLAAARTLANHVSAEMLENGGIYPPLEQIREVSAAIAVAVAEVAYKSGLATQAKPEDLLAHIRSQMYEPLYRTYV
jgi:malate dehydrogenase (oxaloacetate-decarboxylating)(NADP+)